MKRNFFLAALAAAALTSLSPMSASAAGVCLTSSVLDGPFKNGPQCENVVEAPAPIANDGISVVPGNGNDNGNGSGIGVVPRPQGSFIRVVNDSERIPSRGGGIRVVDDSERIPSGGGNGGGIGVVPNEPSSGGGGIRVVDDSERISSGGNSSGGISVRPRS